jgi:HlyD family secretion protein
VEGRTDTVEVGAAIDGVLSAVYVQEGDAVRRGQLLAEIACDDLRQNELSAQAQAEAARQVKVRLLRGHRDEERLSAEQRTLAAKAVRDQARIHLDRMRSLHQQGVMARVVYEEAQRDFDVAEAQLRAAQRDEELIKAPPLAEEVSRADADIAAAGHRVQLAAEQIAKCAVRAPMDGTILRVLLRKGESFSTISPKPLFTMADLSRLRVRAEVDEKDVTKVQLGQRAAISTNSSEQTMLSGTVVRISPTMGRKKALTGDPADKADRDVLEVLVELPEGTPQLPVGLRVTVRFEGL